MAICVLMAAGTASAEDPPDPVVDALHARVSQFLQAVALNTSQAAYQELLAGSPLLKQNEALATLVEQTGKIKERCGEYRALERIETKRLGNDVVLLTYLYKCESFPVVWRFIFYRTPPRGGTTVENSPWPVIGVRFDTDLEHLDQ
jgi:hypothetical protein